MLKIDGAAVSGFDFEGLRIRDLTAGRVGSASIAEVRVPPSGRHRRARSTHSDKYYLVLDGSVEFQVDEENIPLGTGDLLIIEKASWFSYLNRQRIPARLLLVHVPPFDSDTEEFA